MARIASAAIFVLILACARVTSASPIRVDFSGHLTAVSGFSDISVGDAFHGSYFFDDATPAAGGTATSAFYNQVGYFDTIVGTHEFAFGSPSDLSQIQIANACCGPGPLCDCVSFQASGPVPSNASQLLSIESTTNSAAVTSVLLPDVALLNWSLFQDGRSWNYNAFPGLSLVGTVDTITAGPSAVPEPASLVLLGTGLLAVARRRLRARRS